jgi:hypothetical protein
VRAGVVAHRLLGDDAEYFAVNVAGIEVDLVPTPWWGAGWGVARPVPYGPSGRIAVTSWRLAGRALQGRAPPRAQRRRLAAPPTTPASPTLKWSASWVTPLTPSCAPPRSAGPTSSSSVVHQRNWFERLFERSVTKQLVEHADVPVLVVR